MLKVSPYFNNPLLKMKHIYHICPSCYKYFCHQSLITKRQSKNTNNKFWTIQHLPHGPKRTLGVYRLTTTSSLRHNAIEVGTQLFNTILMWPPKHMKSSTDQRVHHREHTGLLRFKHTIFSIASSSEFQIM